MGYKLKTKKAAAKRFKVTSSGKILREKSGKRHLLSHESPGLKRQRRGAIEISSADERKVKKMLKLN